MCLPLLISKILLLVEQIRPRTSEIDDLWTTVAVLLQARAFEAVERVGDTLTPADDTLVLEVPEGTLVAYSHQSGGSNVGIADRAFAIALVAKTSDRDSGLLAAHH